MNENEKVSFWYSWPVIILAICIFWPVGLLLIFKRLSFDKKAAIKAGGKGLKILGIYLVASGVIGFFGCMSTPDSAEGVIVALFFIVGGIAMIRKAKKIRQEAESIKQYLAIIVNGNVRQLDTIASTTGKSYDVVHREIKNMIEKGYLKNAYIDEGLREVVLPMSNVASSNTPNQETASATLVQTKLVACPCCGANNTISGNSGECEYCGAALE